MRLTKLDPRQPILHPNSIENAQGPASPRAIDQPVKEPKVKVIDRRNPLEMGKHLEGLANGSVIAK